MRVEPFELTSLPQLRELVNQHLSAVVPGWALTGDAVAEYPKRDPGGNRRGPLLPSPGLERVRKTDPVLAAPSSVGHADRRKSSSLYARLAPAGVRTQDR